MNEFNIPIIDVNGIYSEGVYNCGTTFLNSSRNASPNAIMKCISQANETAFMTYCDGVKKLGFEQASTRRIDDNIFTVFENAEKQLFVSYEPNRDRITVILDNLSCKESDFSYGCAHEDKRSAEFYMYGLNLDHQGYDTYNKLNTSGYTNCGMLFVIKCIDNSLIIVDGGEESSFSEQDIDKLNDFLHRVAKKNTDEKIRICCWYLTHAHSDHLRGFFKLMYKYGEQYELERIISNLPDFEKYGGQPVEEMQMFSQFVKRFYPNCKDMKAHVGQKLQLADISIDVLCTHECIVDAQTLDTKKNDLNDRSLVLRFSSGGASFLMLGDICFLPEDYMTTVFSDNTLKCDVVQMAHHCINPLSKIYAATNAQVTFIPQHENAVKTHPVINRAFCAAEHFIGDAFYSGCAELTVGVYLDRGELKVIRGSLL